VKTVVTATRSFLVFTMKHLDLSQLPQRTPTTSKRNFRSCLLKKKEGDDARGLRVDVEERRLGISKSVKGECAHAEDK
jgi:hypothetical protein